MSLSSHTISNFQGTQVTYYEEISNHLHKEVEGNFFRCCTLQIILYTLQGYA